MRGWVAMPDGGFIAAGRAAISPNRVVSFRVYRLDRDGQPALSWGHAGTVDLSLGPFDEDVFDRATTSILGSADDGRVLVGTILSVAPSNTQRGRGYGLRVAAMLRPDGSISPAFGRSRLLDLPGYGRNKHARQLLRDGTIYTRVYDMLADAYPTFIGMDRYGRGRAA